MIFHIGDNGAVTDEEFDEMMEVLSNTRRVLVVNTTVPDGYQYAPNNEVLAEGVARPRTRPCSSTGTPEVPGTPSTSRTGCISPPESEGPRRPDRRLLPRTGRMTRTG